MANPFPPQLWAPIKVLDKLSFKSTGHKSTHGKANSQFSFLSEMAHFYQGWDKSKKVFVIPFIFNFGFNFVEDEQERNSKR